MAQGWRGDPITRDEYTSQGNAHHQASAGLVSRIAARTGNNTNLPALRTVSSRCPSYATSV